MKAVAVFASGELKSFDAPSASWLKSGERFFVRVGEAYASFEGKRSVPIYAERPEPSLGGKLTFVEVSL